MSLVGRLAALIRDLVFSATFGATAIGDIFIVAFRFPNLLRTFFADGAVYGSLVPELATEKDKTSMFKVINQVFANMWLILFILTILVECFAPYVIQVIAPGYVGTENFPLVVKTLRLVFPFLLFFSTVSIFVSLLNALGRFWVHPSSGVILSAAFCTSLYLTRDLEPLEQLRYLSYTVSVAGFCQIIWFYLLSRMDGFRFHFLKPAWPERMITVFKRMAKTSFAAFGMHINTFVDVCIASFLPAGSLSYLVFADRINLLCIELIGTSMGTVLMPNFAHNKDNPKRLIGILEDAIIICLQIVLPVSLVLFFTSDTMIKLFFGRGNFTDANCLATSKALMSYALGLPAFVLTKLLMSFLFSQNKNAIAIGITFITVLFNLIGNLFLMKPLGYLGLAVATSFSMWIGVILYGMYIFHTYQGFKMTSDIIRTLLWATIHGLYIYLLYTAIDLSPHNAFFENLFGLVLIIAVTFVSYFWGSSIMRFNRLQYTKTLV